MQTKREKSLSKLFWEALDYFNECLESDISKENTVIEFFTSENGVAIYEAFCSKYFPKNLKEPYLSEGYFEEFAAQAFLNDDKNGVLIKADVNLEKTEMFLIFLHEISHIFCTRNEIKGGKFFDKYCLNEYFEGDCTYEGYAVWREAIADIMADAVLSDMATRTLDDVEPTVCEYYQELDKRNPDSKKQMSLIIAYVMISNEVAGTTDWEIAEKAIRECLQIKDEFLYSIFKLVFENLHNSPFWTINPDFISSLGSLYLLVLSNKEIGNLATRLFE